MIDKKLSTKIVTIGPEYVPPKGGVAQCIASYENAIFEKFIAITNSCEGTTIRKIWKACTSFLRLFLLLLVNRNIKIVHIHTASYNSFRRSSWYVRLSYMLKRKIVIHIHGGGFKEYYNKEKDFIKPVLAKCDALITLSPSWKCFFEDIVGHKNVYIVPNIIERPVHVNVNNDGIFHLLYMGHIYKAKGIFDLVEVVDEYQDKYRGKFILDIAGGMYDTEMLKQFIVEKHLEDIIHFHGWVSGNEKIKLLNLADAYILPSYTEGVPISILEAASYGLPILSTPVGGIPEIVTERENGILFSPGDKLAMREAIDVLINDSELRNKMGEISKMKSVENYPSQVEMRLKEIYDNIVN